MTLGAVKAGDIVLADRKGRRFFGDSSSFGGDFGASGAVWSLI
jgi:hypothetical protein